MMSSRISLRSFGDFNMQVLNTLAATVSLRCAQLFVPAGFHCMWCSFPLRSYVIVTNP